MSIKLLASKRLATAAQTPNQAAVFIKKCFAQEGLKVVIVSNSLSPVPTIVIKYLTPEKRAGYLTFKLNSGVIVIDPYASLLTEAPIPDAGSYDLSEPIGAAKLARTLDAYAKHLGKISLKLASHRIWASSMSYALERISYAAKDEKRIQP